MHHFLHHLYLRCKIIFPILVRCIFYPDKDGDFFYFFAPVFDHKTTYVSFLPQLYVRYKIISKITPSIFGVLLLYFYRFTPCKDEVFILIIFAPSLFGVLFFHFLFYFFFSAPPIGGALSFISSSLCEAFCLFVFDFFPFLFFFFTL